MESSHQDSLDPIDTSELTILIGDSAGAARTLCCRTVAKGAFRQELHVRDLAPFGASPGRKDGLLS